MTVTTRVVTGPRATKESPWQAPDPVDITFTARLGKVRAGDTWTCVQGKDDGDDVEVHLTERLG